MFYRLLARMAGQILLGLSAFVWGTIAAFEIGAGEGYLSDRAPQVMAAFRDWLIEEAASAPPPPVGAVAAEL